MQRLPLLFGAFLITLGLAASYISASFIANYVESRSTHAVTIAANAEGFNWASIRADGLIVNISGPAPDEADRFNLVSLVGSIVNPNRVVDDITVMNALASTPPRFSLELLRNGDGISLIGLVPEKTGRDMILGSIKKIGSGTTVTDMLETADHNVPEGWNAALEFGLQSLRNLPRSKISITPQRVTITAISDSPSEKERIEGDLARAKPDTVALVMNISAPRPVITPFALRLIIDAAGTRFDACSADTEAARQEITTAAVKAGLIGKVDCTVGLGVPTPRWAEAVESAIGTLDSLGGGSLTFSDADITLVSRDDVRQVNFDSAIAALEKILPDVFSLHAVLPPRPVDLGDGTIEIPEFLVTKSPEGLVQMRGRLQDERTQIAVTTYATALFGRENVDDSTRVDSALPDGWPTRVLAGLEALGKLHNGSLLVQPDMLEIRGVADLPEVRSEVAQILSVKLGDASNYRIYVKYEEALNRLAQLPSPEECVASITNILALQQITFAPGTTKIQGEALDVVEKIAEVMGECDQVAMEIGGHTDSQGRESMNLTISQARAEAVLDTLLSLEILTTNLSAKGYGESQPIADNSTEDGRQNNRRIEFKLVLAETETTAETSEDTITDPAGQTGADGEDHAPKHPDETPKKPEAGNE